jgi:hypothetical protein
LTQGFFTDERRTYGMRGKWIGKALVLATLGAFACSSSSDISDGSLSFTIAEGLLVVVDPGPDAGPVTFGAVVLASAAGSCPLLQAGYTYTLISDTAFLYFPMENLLPDLDAGTLISGTYNIIDLSSSDPLTPGLVANAFTVETDIVCDYTSAAGTGGSVAVVPMDTTAGGSSTVSYSAIFSNTRITGANSLSTCVVNAATVVPDGGCLLP